MLCMFMMLKLNSESEMYDFKSLINCFRVRFNELKFEVLSTTTHLSMQHCFYVVFYIIGKFLVAY